MVSRQRSGRHCERAVYGVRTGIGTDGGTVSRFGRARDDRTTFGRARRTPTQRDCALTSHSRVGRQTNMTRRGVDHALLRKKEEKWIAEREYQQPTTRPARLTMV